LHSTSLQKGKECTRLADFYQVFQKACKSTWISSFIQRNGSDEARWSVSICGESSGLGYWGCEVQKRNNEMKLTVCDKN